MELSYKDYGQFKQVAIDIETKDPLLKEKGPGVYRKDGYILGVSFSVGDLSEYYPLNHKELTTEEKEKNFNYIKDQLEAWNEKIFANALYDLDWLVNGYGIRVNGIIHDIQLAEPLLDEYKSSYSLNSLAKDYLNLSKETDEVFEWCILNNLRTTPKNGGREHLYLVPLEIISKYASTDAELTFKIFQLQYSKLVMEDLLNVYRIETGLIPLLLKMRKQGVRLDIKKLRILEENLITIADKIQNELNQILDTEINVNSGRDLEAIFKKKGLPIEYNEPTELMMEKGVLKGNPRFDKFTLSKVNDPIAQKILELRHIKTLLNMFLKPYPELLVEDRIRSNFHPLRNDDYGTVSGRFSSSNPNLQQVSAKKEEDYMTEIKSDILNGAVVRKLFIPEEGCVWAKLDWSQIEYRLIAHYALGQGAEEIRRRYNEDPNTDYHDEMGKMTGIDDRKTVKTLNFGAAYGMGPAKMALVYGWDLEEAKAIYKMYHSKVPFVKETANRVALKAKKVGFIKTMLGRRARLKDASKGYVMFNRLIQGSAADLMKLAMYKAYQEGVYDVLYPHITVHDELDQSVPKTKEGKEALKLLKNIMETCYTLKVPIKAELEIGENWGELISEGEFQW